MKLGNYIFKAQKAAHRNTIEDMLWIMAKAVHTKFIAPLINLLKVIRYSFHL
jgi:hypothetical protein